MHRIMDPKKMYNHVLHFLAKSFFSHLFLDRSQKSPLTPTPKDRCFHPGDEGIGGQDFGDDLYLRRLFFFHSQTKHLGHLIFCRCFFENKMEPSGDLSPWDPGRGPQSFKKMQVQKTVVDGRTPIKTHLGCFETLKWMGYPPYQLVHDFLHIGEADIAGCNVISKLDYSWLH